jgi:hypothetical protein
MRTCLGHHRYEHRMKQGCKRLGVGWRKEQVSGAGGLHTG